MTYEMPICYSCKWFRKDASSFSCDAFPDGIPSAIYQSEHDHRKPYRGDGGLTYEPKQYLAPEERDATPEVIFDGEEPK